MSGLKDRVRTWWDRTVGPTAAWAAAGRFQSDNMGDHAAALSYYGALAIFPALLVGLTILGLAGEEQLVADVVEFAKDQGASAATGEVVESVARTATERSSEELGIALVVSPLFAVNAASGIWGGAGRAINVAYGADEQRGFLRRRLVTIALTLVAITFFLLSVTAVFLGEDWARSVFGHIGLGDLAESIWVYVRWPIAILFAFAALSTVYRYAPDPQARRRRFVTTGALVTVAFWVAATIGFSFYVENFGRYGALYGAAASIIVLLLWLYLVSMGFLFGAELDAELRRRRSADVSPPPEQAAGDP
jgi:membrane protein